MLSKCNNATNIHMHIRRFYLFSCNNLNIVHSCCFVTKTITRRNVLYMLTANSATDAEPTYTVLTFQTKRPTIVPGTAPAILKSILHLIHVKEQAFLISVSQRYYCCRTLLSLLVYKLLLLMVLLLSLVVLLLLMLL